MIVAQPNKRLKSYIGLQFGRALFLVLSTLMTYSAMAGSCEETTRGLPWFGNGQVDTTVVNNTKKTFMVQFLRDGYAKKTVKVAAGESASKLIKFTLNSDNYYIKFTTKIWTMSEWKGEREYPAYCTYSTTYYSGGSSDKLKWAPAQDPICKDVSSTLCDNCSISCEKSYRSGKGRYNTKFTINAG
ncbi:MAG: hypothetical protein R3F37_07570 [Candidatus Competibacteraceae bacterium]